MNVCTQEKNLPMRASKARKQSLELVTVFKESSINCIFIFLFTRQVNNLKIINAITERIS
jgi:hypothetical protein